MKIGFIDHHLNNYHANKFIGLLRDSKSGAPVEVVAAYESDPTGEDWCEKNRVPRADSTAAVVAQSDAIILLAPDNTDAHLSLSKEALESGKPLFVDRVLSDNLEDARKIISTAEQHNTPLMSSSGLRFSTELESLLALVGDGPYEGIFSRGLGKWPGYAVHTVQPAMRLLGGRLARVIDTGKGDVHNITVENNEGRRAQIDIRLSDNQMETTPWQVGLVHHKNYEIATIKQYDEFYANLMKQVVRFFQTHKSPVPVGEMLDTVLVQVLADRSFNTGGQWISVEQ